MSKKKDIQLGKQDERIAREVMKWKPKRDFSAGVRNIVYMQGKIKAKYVMDWDGDNSFMPSSRLADAWLVVEKLNSKGGCFSLINDDFGHWALVSDGIQPSKARFSGATTFFVQRHLWADSAAQAICIAALRKRHT